MPTSPYPLVRHIPRSKISGEEIDSKRFWPHERQPEYTMISRQTVRKGEAISGIAAPANHRTEGDLFRGGRGKHADAKEGGRQPPPSP